MLIIDDAGTGCLIGKMIVAAYREETKESWVHQVDDMGRIKDLCFDLLVQAGATKDEPIRVCRGQMFFGFVGAAMKAGYQIEAGKIEGEAQDVIEGIFMEQLYGLGMSRSVILHDKDYEQLHYDILNDLFLHPELLQHVRPERMLGRSICEVRRKIDRLQNEFPNLYQALLEEKAA